MDTVIITPEQGKAALVGQLLLGLADRPADVKWVTYPTAGFEVPAVLLPDFEAAMADLAQAYEEPAPKTFTDGDTDRKALEKRERARKGRKASAPKAEEEEN